jgi:phospholipid/cholesterol/gamma-HCH transport system ATP-binding protein
MSGPKTPTATLGRQETDEDLMAAIEFKDVCKNYGDRAVLSHVSIRVPKNETTVLLGPSGAGKSTLLRLATGLLKPTSGDIFVLGENINELPHAKLLVLRQRLGMLFQEGALFGSLSVAENVGFPLRHILGHRGEQYFDRVSELLKMVGLSGLDDRLPSALSGGQRKRVALARAIALQPEIVFFDEPTSGLDPQTSAAIDVLITDMQKKLDVTFLVITHDVLSAANIADHAGVVLENRMHAFGPKKSIWESQDPRIRSFLDRKPPDTPS